MMFGVAFLAPLLVRPLARVLGWPMARLQGLTGKLARENAIRQPQRTAVTAAALMVGLALVVLVAIFAAGLTRVDRQDDRRPGAGRDDRPEPGRLLADLGRGRRTASRTSRASRTSAPFRFALGIADGDGEATTAVNGIDPATVTSMITLKWDAGRRADARAG